MLFAIRTRRLGDAMHAYAVVSSGAADGGSSVFSVHADHAPLFSSSKLTLVLSPRGTTWWTNHSTAFRGPRHNEHVRVTMARAAGVSIDDGALSASLEFRKMPVRRRYVVVCPDTAVRYKEWSEHRWQNLMESLVSRGFVVAVCHGKGRARMGLPTGAHHVDANLLELAHLMRSSAFVVGTDSGHLHLADAIGVPVVGLYGATSSVTYGPFHNRHLCVDAHRDAFPSSQRYSTSVHIRGRAMEAVAVDDVIAVTSSVEVE